MSTVQLVLSNNSGFGILPILSLHHLHRCSRTADYVGGAAARISYSMSCCLLGIQASRADTHSMTQVTGQAEAGN